ncbi:hypothetical protein Pmani_007440 [Petrolisthes manimaculis]|uniref:Uncharacterized protein n=1 Tax=Petrolisthes manimaculis TaxID=1843537 RepID=A0AAE1UEV0_9EUCA|nr:hypothetical protein Pmani_007440 [Petrolisthes manimaculis]
MPSEVFLELSVGGRCLGRVYIHLWTEMRRAHQFLTLCMGTLGPSYRGAKSREVRNQGKPGEVMVFPYHVESDREINEAIFSNIERGDRLETMVEGLIGANIQPLQPSLHQHLVPFNYPQQYNCIYQAQTYGDYASYSDDETYGFMICTIGSPKVKWSRPFESHYQVNLRVFEVRDGRRKPAVAEGGLSPTLSAPEFRVVW